MLLCRRALFETGKLLIAFLIGSFSTVIGTIMAMTLFPLRGLQGEGWKVASALCGRHIGKGISVGFSFKFSLYFP